jgi:hypothetical protein
MPELKIASSMRICSGFGFHLGFGSGVRSSHPVTENFIKKLTFFSSLNPTSVHVGQEE